MISVVAGASAGTRLCVTRNLLATNAASVSVAVPDGLQPVTW
jgi:hypothetical protein